MTREEVVAKIMNHDGMTVIQEYLTDNPDFDAFCASREKQVELTRIDETITTLTARKAELTKSTVEEEVRLG